MCRRRARALVRGLAGLAALAAGLVAAPSALADTPFGLSCGDNGNLKVCNGSVKTFDGVPLDLTVTFPASATCTVGRCGHVCSSGTADCDGDLEAPDSNGCEVSLNDTALHCGACNLRCDAPAGFR